MPCKTKTAETAHNWKEAMNQFAILYDERFTQGQRDQGEQMNAASTGKPPAASQGPQEIKKIRKQWIYQTASKTEILTTPVCAEHVLAIIKRQWGFSKVRYRDLHKSGTRGATALNRRTSR
jgi:hypothetical protein